LSKILTAKTSMVNGFYGLK